MSTKISPRAVAKLASRKKRPAAQLAPPTKPLVRASRTSAKPRPATGSSKPTPAPALNKRSSLVALLRSSEGGTIDQMTALTGWQAHTVRGVISGVLRKRLSLNVTCVPPVGGGAGIYRIASPIAA